MESRTVAPNARAAVFAAVCTLLAVVAHLPMSAEGIPVAAVIIGAAAVFCFARVAAGGERGQVAIGALVGGSQIGLHLLFQAAQSAQSVPSVQSVQSVQSVPSASGDGGMASMSGMLGMSETPGIHAIPSAASSMGLSPTMTVAHVLAAAAAAWWLRRGEAAAFACARRTWDLVAVPLAWLVSGFVPVLPSPRAIPGAYRSTAPATPGRLIQFVVIRRGPPTVDC